MNNKVNYKKRTKNLNYRVLVLNFIILCMLGIGLIRPVKAEEATNNNYLVLIQNEDNSWTAYNNLVEKSSQGNIMVKAKATAKALNLTYTNYHNGKFSIKSDINRYNLYIKNKGTYNYISSNSSTVEKKTICAPYTSKNGYNLCHMKTLSTLSNFNYFNGLAVSDYQKKGYKGVVCYSKYNKITNVPSIDGVVNMRRPKLIIIGDSRTNNMRKWVSTSTDTEFVAKSGQGYQWFMSEGIDQVNSIKERGDVIIFWLGVNDYFSKKNDMDSWLAYAIEINSLANGQWSDCKIFVAEVGYVDAERIYKYYGVRSRSNVTPVTPNYNINGIQEFNTKLKDNLNDNIKWISTNDIIGIHSNDYESTPEELWYTRDNGMKDGLHYGIEKTQEIYNYFVKVVKNLL